MAIDAGTSEEGADKFPPAALFAKLQARYASSTAPRSGPTRRSTSFSNTRVPPFNDLRVRRAVNYAVDRNRMGDLRGGPQLEQPSCQVLPPTLDGYRRYCPYTIRPSAVGSYEGPGPRKGSAARRRLRDGGSEGDRRRHHRGLPAARRQLSRLGAEFPRLQGSLQELRAATPTSRRSPIHGCRIQAGIAGWFQDSPDTRRLLRFSAHVSLVRSGLEGQHELRGVLQSSHRRGDGPRALAPRHVTPERPRGSGARSTGTSSTRRPGSSCRTHCRSSWSPGVSATTSTAPSGVLSSTSSGCNNRWCRAPAASSPNAATQPEQTAETDRAPDQLVERERSARRGARAAPEGRNVAAIRGLVDCAQKPCSHSGVDRRPVAGGGVGSSRRPGRGPGAHGRCRAGRPPRRGR